MLSEGCVITVTKRIEHAKQEAVRIRAAGDQLKSEREQHDARVNALDPAASDDVLEGQLSLVERGAARLDRWRARLRAYGESLSADVRLLMILQETGGRCGLPECVCRKNGDAKQSGNARPESTASKRGPLNMPSAGVVASSPAFRGPIGGAR